MNVTHKTVHSHRLRPSSALPPWSKLPVYRARILTADVVDIVVKSAPRLAVGQRISFATLSELASTESTTRPSTFHNWRSGIIWRIEKGLLRLTGT